MKYIAQLLVGDISVEVSAGRMSTHISRAWGAETTKLPGCTCKHEPCGYVDETKVDDCPQHSFGSGKTIRSTHHPDKCPANFHPGIEQLRENDGDREHRSHPRRRQRRIHDHRLAACDSGHRDAARARTAADARGTSTQPRSDRERQLPHERRRHQVEAAVIVYIDGPDELVPVPRVEDLVRLGHAKPHPQGGYTISPRGYELIREAERHNAPALKRRGEAEETRRIEGQRRAAERVITIDSEVGRGWQHKG